MFSPTVFFPYPFFNGMSNLLFGPFGQNACKPPQAPSVALPQDERCLRKVHLSCDGRHDLVRQRLLQQAHRAGSPANSLSVNASMI
jgi:hypothetical protein